MPQSYGDPCGVGEVRGRSSSELAPLCIRRVGGQEGESDYDGPALQDPGVSKRMARFRGRCE